MNSDNTESSSTNKAWRKITVWSKIAITGKRKRWHFKAEDMVVIEICIEDKGNKKYKVEGQNNVWNENSFFFSLGDKFNKRVMKEMDTWYTVNKIFLW